MHSTSQISVDLYTAAVYGYMKEEGNYEHSGTWNK
jgi:hypothetical protein